MQNVDGINKINKEEVKKSRQIVLSAIKKHDEESTVNEVLDVPKKKYFNIDGIRENLKSEKKPVLIDKNIKEEKSPSLIKVEKAEDFQATKKVDSIIISEEPKIKKVSKEKRMAWLNEMKGVLTTEKESLKEADYKIKKVVKLTEEEPSLFEKKKDIDFLEREKMAEKELAKRTNEKNKAIIKEASNKKVVKQTEEKPDDFDFDLTPALSRKIYRKETAKSETEKKKKSSFIERLKEKRKENQEKKRVKERLILEKIENQKKQQEKKDAEEKTRENLKILKDKKDQKKKEQQKIQRKENVKKIKLTVKSGFFSLKRKFIVLLKFSAWLFLAAFSTALFCYLIFFTMLVKLNFDNVVLRKLAIFFPVPAIVSGDGFIEYYKFKDLKEDFYINNKSLAGADFKVFLIKRMIISELSRQYNLKFSDVLDNNLLSEIEKKIIFDNDINQVAINRMRKIKEFITSGEDFMKISSKYGDSQGVISIEVGSDNKFNNFKTDLLALDKGEVSRVEYASDGYYLFQAVNKTEKNSEISYVFIKAKTLDEHIRDEVALYKMWSFVD